MDCRLFALPRCRVIFDLRSSDNRISDAPAQGKPTYFEPERCMAMNFVSGESPSRSFRTYCGRQSPYELFAGMQSLDESVSTRSFLALLGSDGKQLLFEKSERPTARSPDKISKHPPKSWPQSR